MFLILTGIQLVVVSREIATEPSYEKFVVGYVRNDALSGSSVKSGVDLNVNVGARGIRK